MAAIRSRTRRLRIMKRVMLGHVVAGCLLLSGCGNDTGIEGGSPAGSEAHFIVTDESLGALKTDFNAAAGKIRLLFLSGPTCGICLRGLADMDGALLAGSRDPRLRTFVVHVPALGADEGDARNSTVLIDNPYTRHYWEDSGVIGHLYQEVMEIDSYAWDMWFIYGPKARWDDRLPPEPAFWMHQLGSLPDDRYLDADEFAAKANEMLNALPQADEPIAPGAGPAARSAEIETVAQPAGVALEQHIMGRGGYHNLSAMNSIRMTGTINSSEGTMPLVVTANSDGTLIRTVGEGDAESIASRRQGKLKPPAGQHDRGMPWSLEKDLMAAYEITGPLVAWKRKGHRLDDTVDMVRTGGDMTWELDLVQAEGYHWRVYIDSHTGMERRRVLLNEANGPEVEIRFDDYRVAEADTPYESRFPARKGRSNWGFFDVSGLVFPYSVEYRAPDGRVIASESFDSIDVEFHGRRE